MVDPSLLSLCMQDPFFQAPGGECEARMQIEWACHKAAHLFAMNIGRDGDTGNLGECIEDFKRDTYWTNQCPSIRVVVMQCLSNLLKTSCLYSVRVHDELRYALEDFNRVATPNNSMVFSQGQSITL